MRISPETVQNKLESVPEDVRAQVVSEEVAQTLSQIGRDHALHIDKQGILDEETLYIMLGLESADDFVDKLKSRLDIDEGKAIAIARDVNEKIFLAIRRSLMEMQAAQEAPVLTETAPQAPIAEKPAERLSSREEILADIENPTPAIHPISAADQTIPGPARATEITPADKAAATSFIAGKLSETVSMPPQKAVFEEKKVPEKPKGYAADPYREPIM